MHISHDDKRADRRVQLDRAVKMYDPRGGKYMPGHTLNVSAGGMLVALRGGAHLPGGSPIEVAVDWAGSADLLSQSDLVPATVVRRAGVNGAETYVALQFASRQELALAA